MPRRVCGERRRERGSERHINAQAHGPFTDWSMPAGGGTRQLTPAHWRHLSPVAVMAGQEDPVQREIHQDWANREYIEVITSSIKKIADFLNSFGQCGGGIRDAPGLHRASFSGLPRVHPGISGLIRVYLG